MLHDLRRIILFVDMDAYFASCEIASRPYLRGKPVAVTNHYRHIVLTASYEARKYGVKTGMPLFEALKLCRNLRVVHSDTDKYISTTTEIHKLLLEITDQFEPLSIDEAVMDITQQAGNYEEARKIAEKIKSAIRNRFNITCSVGISPTRIISKYCAGINKPDGLYVIDNKSFEEGIKKIAVEEIAGIGKSTGFTLKSMGIRTAHDLMSCNIAPLLRVFGQNAFYLKTLVTNDVVGSFYDEEPAKSIGASHTLVRDTDDPEILHSFLEYLVWKVASKLHDEGAEANEISLGIRFSDFSSIHRSVRLKSPATDMAFLYTAGKKLLDEYIPPPRPVRLLSFRTKCTKPVYRQLEIEMGSRRKRIEEICRPVNEKYGKLTIKPAFVLLFEKFGRPESVIPPVFTDTEGRTYRKGRGER